MNISEKSQKASFKKVNKTLDGALDGTPTWENERKKSLSAFTLKAKILKLMAYLNGTRLFRANARYNIARGYLLAGGIAYSALFSIVGTLTIAFTFFSVALGNNRELFKYFTAQINKVLPGILKTAQNPQGLLDAKELIVENPINIVSLISLLVLLWSSLSLMSGLRLAIWSMFGIAKLPMAFISQKIRDFGAFLVLFVSVIVSAVISASASFFAEPIFDFLNFPRQGAIVIMFLISIALGIFIDTLVFAFVFSILAGIKAPKKDLWFGSLIAGTFSTTVRALGTMAVSSVANNPLLAPFAAIVTILLWVNLISRITLNVAAFIANPPEPLEVTAAHFPHATDTPNYVTKSELKTLAWEHDPISGVLLPDLRAGIIEKIDQEVSDIGLTNELTESQETRAEKEVTNDIEEKERRVEEREKWQARKAKQTAELGFDPYNYDVKITK